MHPKDDPFVGTWELDPETQDYQDGRPGRRATYTVQALPGGLMFTLWPNSILPVNTPGRCGVLSPEGSNHSEGA